MTATVIPFRKAEGPITELEAIVEVLQRHTVKRWGRPMEPARAAMFADALRKASPSQ